MTNSPIEPSADMRAFAKMCHEMFVALQMEDFSTQEALIIIGQMLAANRGGGS